MGDCGGCGAEIARLDERISALRETMSRSESVSIQRVVLAKEHLDHRLDVLNHAHQQSLQDRAQYVTRVEIRWLMGTLVVLFLALVGYVVAK